MKEEGQRFVEKFLAKYFSRSSSSLVTHQCVLCLGTFPQPTFVSGFHEKIYCYVNWTEENAEKFNFFISITHFISHIRATFYIWTNILVCINISLNYIAYMLIKWKIFIEFNVIKENKTKKENLTKISLCKFKANLKEHKKILLFVI